LQGLQRELLDAPIPLALARATRPPRMFSWAHGMAAGLLLAIGFGSGWWLRPGATRPTTLAAAEPPAFVREARGAHAVYVPEQRHPVEVGAEQQAHLIQWLSKRLGRNLQAPQFDSQGFHLIGGRLLPNDAGQPRALLMYENASGARVTLHISALDGALATERGRFEFSGSGATETFYWVQGKSGYALSGNIDRATLAKLADLGYSQLNLQ
jgi:anti-sigma factor RsiW